MRMSPFAFLFCVAILGMVCAQAVSHETRVTLEEDRRIQASPHWIPLEEEPEMNQLLSFVVALKQRNIDTLLVRGFGLHRIRH